MGYLQNLGPFLDSIYTVKNSQDQVCGDQANMILAVMDQCVQTHVFFFSVGFCTL